MFIISSVDIYQAHFKRKSISNQAAFYGLVWQIRIVEAEANFIQNSLLCGFLKGIVHPRTL